MLPSLVFSLATLSTTPALEVRILSAIADGAPDATEKKVRLGTPVTLVLSVRDPKLGWISAPPPNSAEPWQVRWYKIEVADHALSNTEPSFHWEPIHYQYVPIAGCDDRFRCPADLHATLLSDRGGLGTMAFRAEVTHGALSGASLGKEQLYRGGLAPQVARVTVRRDDSYLGYLTELFNTPYIWGSAGEPASVHQADRRIGSDCADFVTYGIRRLGRDLPYTSTFGLPSYTDRLASSKGPSADGIYRGEDGQPIRIGDGAIGPGDLLLFPRHVGALLSDEAPLGVLSSSDRMIHTSWSEPAEQAIGETDYKAQPISVLRWKGLAAPRSCAQILADAGAADRRLRIEESCAESDLSLMRRGIEALTGPPCSAISATISAHRWSFPIRGQRPETAITEGGRGYLVNHSNRCFAIRGPGHPALDLFVPDPERTIKDAEGRPFPAVAVDDAAVLATRIDWTPGDLGKGGNYVVLYLPAAKLLAYYAHLDRVEVVPGQRLVGGQSIGTVGRTGLNAYPARSPTHLHFALWDPRTLAPINPFQRLSKAQVEALR